MDDERFDGMYMNLAGSVGGIDPLLDSFFGFLRRKTDFFTGAADSDGPQQKVLEAFLKNKARADEDVREKAAKDKKRKAEEEKRRQRIEAEKLAKQQVRLRAMRGRSLSTARAARTAASHVHERVLRRSAVR